MAHIPSLQQIEARAEAAAKDLERFTEQRLRSLTCNGSRVPTQAELERLAREGADYLQRRMGY